MVLLPCLKWVRCSCMKVTLPTYSTHTDQSRMCSSCHTLITETADLNGNLTGGEFIEQATYREYLNSSFPSNNIKCQTCHMPQLSDPVVIANGFIAFATKISFNQHVFAGRIHSCWIWSGITNKVLVCRWKMVVLIRPSGYMTANLMLNSVDMSLSFWQCCKWYRIFSRSSSE